MELELSQDAKTVILETMDVGATNSGSTGNWQTWQDARDFKHIRAVIEVGTWDGTDDLDTCKLQQATDDSGTGVKDLTTSASAGDYDTDNPVDADGDQVIIECPTDKLDVDNAFRYVRVYCAEVTGTGTDNITGALILKGANHKKENLHATPVTGSIVYVRT